VVNKKIPLTFIAAVCALASGCSMFHQKPPGSRLDYKTAKTLKSLEVPPDMTQPTGNGEMVLPQTGNVTLSQAEAQMKGQETADTGTQQVLPGVPGVTVMRDGKFRWLRIDESPDKVWATVQRFWSQNGFKLKVDKPRIGIMETQWAENRADIPGGIVRGLIEKVFKNAYSSDTRDKFRVRLEPTDDRKATNLYLTQYGVEQVQVNEEQLKWVPRPSDPELANGMLNRIMEFMGVGKQKAKAMIANAKAPPEPAVHLTHDATGQPVLTVADSFERTWRRVGIALDQTGMVVEDRNRSQGIYYVRQENLAAEVSGSSKSSGWFSHLFSSKEKSAQNGKRFQIQVAGDSQQSSVLVMDNNGKPDSVEHATTVLDKLRKLLQ